MEKEEEIIKEILDGLDMIKQEIDKLKLKLPRIKSEEVITHVFDTLMKITNNTYNSIIYINNNTVKYIRKDVGHEDFPCLIIYNNKGYTWKNYDFQNTIIVRYYNEYDIPDYLLNILDNLPESPIEYSDPVYFKLYYLLKQKYGIIFVRGN